jgi:hypothetical protein
LAREALAAYHPPRGPSALPVAARSAQTLGSTNKATAVTPPQSQAPVPLDRWKGWLGLVLLLPLTAASGGVLFGLYRHVVTGQLSTVAKSYGTTSRTISFAESPVWFLLFFMLHAALAAGVILVTIVVAKLAVKRLRRARS